ncbi:uncharacterized protein [Antedon mediterranea]|uniref:uncharacterized protein n=1 Tax=Antedon mediterranea TaxID=105859 RepID=UPI003AF83982
MNSKLSAMYSKCRRVQAIGINKYTSKFDFSKDDRVLDVGCGSGNFTSDIARNVSSVVGIDVSNDMIDYAKQHHQLSNVEYVVCDAQDLTTVINVAWAHQIIDVDLAMDYEGGLKNDLDLDGWCSLLETEGFSLVSKEAIDPSLFIIENDYELYGYVRTLSGQLTLIPDDLQDEFVKDAMDWCKREMPKEGTLFVSDNMDAFKLEAWIMLA